VHATTLNAEISNARGGEQPLHSKIRTTKLTVEGEEEEEFIRQVLQQ